MTIESRTRIQFLDLQEFARFFLTGVTATAGNLSAVWLTRRYVNFEVALVFGVCTGLLISFLMSKLYAFRSTSWGRFHIETLRFLTVYAIGAALYWIVGVIAGHYVLARFLNTRFAELTGAFLGASCMAFTSYFGHRFFTYQTHQSETGSMSDTGRRPILARSSDPAAINAWSSAAFLLRARALPLTVTLISTLTMLIIGSRFALRRAFATLAHHSDLGNQAQDLSPSLMLYNRVVISLDYINHGFVRRGLGGTIASLLSGDYIGSGFLFTIVSLVFLVIPVACLIYLVATRRSVASASYLAAVITLSPQTFQAWAPDVVRTDMLVVGFIAWSSLALVMNYRRTAFLVLLVGYLAHETAIIFGVPLLVAECLWSYKKGQLSGKDGVWLATGALASLVAVVLLQAVFAPTSGVVRSEMIAAGPVLSEPAAKILRDIAIFMATSGARGLKDALCYNTTYNHQYFFMVAMSIIVLLLYLIILGLGNRLIYAVISIFAPLAFLLIVAMDGGRWLSFAVVNGWLLATFLRINELRKAPGPRSWAIGGALLALLIAMGPTTVNAVNGTARTLGLRLGLSDPGPYESWLDQCDPTWRALVYDRQSEATP